MCFNCNQRSSEICNYDAIPKRRGACDLVPCPKLFELTYRTYSQARTVILGLGIEERNLKAMVHDEGDGLHPGLWPSPMIIRSLSSMNHPQHGLILAERLLSVRAFRLRRLSLKRKHLAWIKLQIQTNIHVGR